MRPITQAFALFRRERGLWRYAFKPLLWGIAAYAFTIVMIGGAALGVGEYLGGRTGGWIGLAIGVALPIVFGGGLYLALVALISGFGFDRLSMEVEERAFGRAAGRPMGFAQGLGSGIVRFGLAAALGLVGLCLSGTVVAPWLIASLLALLDTTAPALSRRGVGLSGQFGALRRAPGALGYGLLAGAILLVPVVNVLALPLLVAAGTILVAEGETSFSL